MPRALDVAASSLSELEVYWDNIEIFHVQNALLDRWTKNSSMEE